jgi:hypothetical protein
MDRWIDQVQRVQPREVLVMSEGIVVSQVSVVDDDDYDDDDGYRLYV